MLSQKEKDENVKEQLIQAMEVFAPSPGAWEVIKGDLEQKRPVDVARILVAAAVQVFEELGGKKEDLINSA